MVEDKSADSGEAGVQPVIAPCRKLELTAPLRWLAEGWADMKHAPVPSLTFGAVMMVILWLLAGVVWQGSYWLPFAVLMGVVFPGPVLCLGLYAISAQLERKQPARLGYSVREAAVRRLSTELVFALILLIIFLVWARAASMVNIFFPVEVNPGWQELTAYLVVGSAVGAIFAALTFAASAFSLPMMMHRDVDAITAVLTSINAVLRNKGAMLVWIAIIIVAVLIAIGTFFIGAIVTLPLIGHATWHAYLDTIDASDFPRHAEGITATPRARD
jgi:uncharacterized membrane protein